MHVCVRTKAERESGTKPRIGHMTITHYVIQCSLKKPRNPSKEARLSFRAGARESLGSRLYVTVNDKRDHSAQNVHSS